MKNVNQRRKYSNIKQFNDCCATALHVAEKRWSESMGCTLCTGGEIDLIVFGYPERLRYKQKVAKKNRNILRKVRRLTNA
jgi:hypothetical protein